ncbi:hypothetical protein ROA7450_00289 [Roseovarius albus]|uniref:Uncharacterized protein n=1 Tax=Roseovarius albus TaxID=1247867 RepID=A0A1X6Y9F2_9RHOB|nr:hypothetical protein ROA7450_00289 [Roseovarius albus]
MTRRVVRFAHHVFGINVCQCGEGGGGQTLPTLRLLGVCVLMWG